MNKLLTKKMLKKLIDMSIITKEFCSTAKAILIPIQSIFSLILFGFLYADVKTGMYFYISLTCLYTVFILYVAFHIAEDISASMFIRLVDRYNSVYRTAE